MKAWQQQLEMALVEILGNAAREFQGEELKVIDIGVFPWHSSIELSLLFTGDSCDVDDIAAWPNYDYSQFNEGGWESAVSVANALNQEWELEKDTEVILKGVVETLKLTKVSNQLIKFNKASNFLIQVVNPDGDDHSNYYT